MSADVAPHDDGVAGRPGIEGRAADIAACHALVRAASDGRGGALVVTGGFGIGLSTVLGQAVPAQSRTRVVRLSGIATERPLPGAAAQRFIAALTGGPAVDPGPVAPHALLTALAAGDGPVTVLVDDAAEIDDTSLESLGFAARRLATLPVALIVAMARPPGRPRVPDPVADLDRRELAPLDDDAARRVVLATVDAPPGGVPDDVLVALVRLGRGNPLALTDVATALSPAQLAGEVALPRGLPTGGRLRERHRRALAALPPSSREILLLAAAQPDLDEGTLLRAAELAGHPPQAVDATVASGLLRVQAGQVAPVDELLRGSVYDEAAPARRLAAHRRLADALEPAAHRLDRAWHLARSRAARAGSTDSAADELFAAATAAVADGERNGVSRCLELAAELTTSPGPAAERLVAAARAAWQAGDVLRARMLLGRARRLAGDSAPRDTIDLLLGEIELRSGSARAAHQALDRAAEGLDGPGRRAAVTALLHTSQVDMLAGEYHRYLALADRVARFARPDDDALTRLMFTQFTGFAAVFRGQHARAVGPLRSVVETGAATRDPGALVLATLAAITLGDGPVSRATAELAVTAAQEPQAGANLPVALEFLAFTQVQNDLYDAAGTNARESLRLAARAGQHNTVAACLAVLAMISTVVPDDGSALERAEAAARRADARGMCRPRALVAWAALRYRLAHGRTDGLLAALQRATAPGRSGHAMHPTIRVLATPDLVEVATRLGETDAIDEPLAVFERWAAGMGSVPMLALAARCRALRTDGRAAVEAFEEALELHAAGGCTFERARTQLLLGRALRRTRRPASARQHLAEAAEHFDGLGARPWAAQARAELRAAGGGTAPARATVTGLTPQQQEITRLVAAGATNREIAARLFLSPRTVDHHLRNIFVRLGVRSRVELARLVAP